MRVTVPGGVDLEVRPGTPVRDIVAGAPMREVWCGSTRLDEAHPAGAPPLVHGAHLTSRPGEELVTPRGPHVVVVEGPDAGGMRPLPDGGLVVGSGANADLRVDDVAMSGRHAHVTIADGGRAADLRSTNGTRGGRRVARGGAVMGRSKVTLVSGAQTEEALSGAAPAMGARGMVAGVGGAVMMAVVTGRWWIALIGLALPAVMLAPSLWRRLRARADGEEKVESDPVEPPGGGPLAVIGDPEPVNRYLRALAVARGRRLIDPATHEPWTRWLGPSVPGDEVVVVAAGEDAPSWCARSVAVSAERRVDRGPQGVSERLPLGMSQERAEASARRWAAAQHADGLPRRARWADLGDSNLRESHAGRHLGVAIGSGQTGPCWLDLAVDGPHLLVAGTTGSGKSVLLETLVAGLAHAAPPTDITFALVDFKGGAGLRAVMNLPHVAARLTDLDAGLARRALTALSHELASRKDALRAAGHSDLGDWERLGGAPPRLVVVIDEYQEISAQLPDFIPDLARLAAQGRSLGLHLVLATQRPAGAVTPEVRANVSTTIALRVASAAESRDILGTTEAAEIDRSTPGRAIVSRAGRTETVQVAEPCADPSPAVWPAEDPLPPGMPLATAASQRWEGVSPATPLWTPPLPSRWSAPTGSAPITVALGDWPQQRLQRTVSWTPSDGALVVVGPARSGRTSALRAVAAQAESVGLTPVWLPKPARLAARTLWLASRRDDVLLLVDDADEAIARLGATDDGDAVDALQRRVATARPTALAYSSGAPARAAQHAAVLAVLSGLDDHARSMWGVPRDLDPGAGPGRAALRSEGAWCAAHAATAEEGPDHPLCRDLPTSVAHRPGDLGVGGDAGAPVAMPVAPVAVVGTPGEERDAVEALLGDAVTATVDVPTLVPPEARTVVMTNPTARHTRALCPHGWQGLVEPVPIPRRVVLVEDGVGRCVQLPAV